MSSFIFRLHRMHEMLTIVIDVCGVCVSVCLSVMQLKSVVAYAVHAACCVRGVIWCSLCKCLWPLVLDTLHKK